MKQLNSFPGSNALRKNLPLAVMQTLVLASVMLLALGAQAKDAGSLPTTRPELVGMSSERLARIRPAMQRYIDQQLVPGTVTAIMRRGKLVHLEVLGDMDVAAGAPMQRDTVFRIASMSKPIASVALMMLWEEGRFQLRDPVAKFLPEFADPKVSTTGDVSGETGELVPAERPIQILDMLTHTAGLANSYLGNSEFYQQYMADRAPDADLDAYTKRLAELPLTYQPGTQWQYSVATDVVGRLVEVISGMPLDEFLAQRLFQPLGMTDTSFYLDAGSSQAQRLAAQYQPGDDGRIELQDPAGDDSRWVTGPKVLFRGAGGLVSTVDDYLRFQQMMLNGGQFDGRRLLAPSTVSLMIDNHTGDMPIWLAGPGMGFGLGYGVVVDRGAAATPLSQGAAYWGGAYCTISWLDPEQELVAVLMTQVRPYTHINIRQDFQVLTYQAIVE
jgi:CubicO group peptidase (beta-lactamase class C family)